MTPLRLRLLSPDSNHELREDLRRLGADPEQAAEALQASRVLHLRVDGLEEGPRRELKESFRQAGGAAAEGTRGRILLVGPRGAYARCLEALPQGELRAALEGLLRRALERHHRATRVGPLQLDWGKRSYVMGILNVTPDSFSGDGVLARFPGRPVEQALALARQMAEQGADLIDIGGVSTRPGAEEVSPEEELKRVLPVVEAIAQAEPGIALSVDTYRAEVARRVLAAGAHMINDVWALQRDPELGGVVAEAGVPVVLMHNRSDPRRAAYSERLGGHYPSSGYTDLMGEILQDLEAALEQAEAAGIPRRRTIVDPGIGFGKTPSQNVTLLHRLPELRALGRPILIGPSRKSFIGYVLGLPAEERLEGTAAAVAVGIARGADVVRVHDVQEMARVARMTDALVRHGSRPAGPGWR